MIPAEAVEAAVARIVAEAKAVALVEVADHIAARMEEGDAAPVTPAETIAWLRERAEDIRKSTELYGNDRHGLR